MKNMKKHICNFKRRLPRKQEFNQVNEELNLYYEEFQACKKSWKHGIIAGALAAFLLTLFFTGFQIGDGFLGVYAFMTIPCTWVGATIFGLMYTQGFGCSDFCLGIMSIGSGIAGFFLGTYVLAWVALALIGLIMGAWIVGGFIFSLLFPIETLYYWIRYSIEKLSIRNDMRKEHLAAA